MKSLNVFIEWFVWFMIYFVVGGLLIGLLLQWGLYLAETWMIVSALGSALNIYLKEES